MILVLVGNNKVDDKRFKDSKGVNVKSLLFQTRYFTVISKISEKAKYREQNHGPYLITT